MAATNDQIKEILEATGLDKSFDNLKYGGLITTLDLTFRVPKTVENEEFLEHIFGPNWLTYVATKNELDDGIDITNWTGETYYDAQLDITYYVHYRFKIDAFSKLSGEKLAEITARFISIVSDTTKPCPNDQILIIVAIIALTIATAGSGAATGWAAVAQYSAWVAAVIQIGMVLGTFGKRESQYAQYALLALAVAGGYSAWADRAASNIYLASFNFAIQAASIGVQGLSMYEADQHTAEMKKMQKELEQLEAEEQAREFEKAFEFQFSESYDSIYRDGHEANPYQYIDELYSGFSV